MLIEGVKINYGVVDQTIEEDNVTKTSSGNSPYSDMDNVTQTSTDRVQLTYLEKDYFLLDGSHTFPESGESYNVGWESANLSNASGSINEYVEFEFDNLHGSYGIQIMFPYNCVADSFTITHYNGSSVVGTRTVTGNTAATYNNSDVRLNWNKIRITFTKVNPQQRVRLFQVDFGAVDVYDEDTLLSVSASRATDFSGDYDDSGDFTFSFFNDGRFGVHDISDLPIGLQEGLRVAVYIKKQGDTAYTLFGNYFSESTVVEENGRVVTVSGYDELYSLGDTTYRNGIVYPEGRSLYAWAQEVAEDAGIELTIDNAFNNIISTGYITEVPHREALRLIAEAGNGIIVIDKNGNIALKIPEETTIVNLGVDEIVDGSYSVENTEKYLGVSVSKYTFSSASAPQELGHLDEIGLTTEPQEIEITYSEYPVVTSTIQVFVDETSSATIVSTKIYADRCVVTLTGTSGDTTFVTVTGTPYNRATTVVTVGSTAKNIKSIENNYLITGSIANSVANYQYNRVVNKYKHSAEVVTEKEFDIGTHINLNTQNSASSGSGQYVTRVSFEISDKDNSVAIEAVDE